ncbi:Crp/Fnr family transcriptional regulator [Pseudorhodoferax soli]|uniref:CRP-like cAMP-binding protein n=1 Tax=Pseudorhodoferax soli TaxID=545864 RepID=A0A368XY26_9BURK|nr:Crp/Fnr family transcriptional regulator [Pseudorhodoferax soli]RCW71427.1 CRP-like cAMP-binding protein [Pseudorhodoferax soli]
MLTRNVLRNRTEDFTDEERSVLESAVGRTQTHAAGQTVVRQRCVVDTSTVLVQGLMTRHVHAADGRRHLVAVHVPGDFVDLHAYVLKQLDHDLGALTDVTVALVPHAALDAIQARHPQMAKRLWFLTLLDAAMHRQWVIRLASLSALQRVAHFLCEMNAKLLAIGQSDGQRFLLPMTQTDVGEVCGLTNVHVSRVLRQLREMELCSWRGAQVVVHDPVRLAAAGLFAPDYLYLNPAMSLRVAGDTGDANVR